MNTQIEKINPCTDNAQIFSRAGEILRRGGLVAFPTETVYGLGGNALDNEAAAKIYAAKGRPSDNPLIVHLSSVDEAELYCYTNELFYRLAKAFMPGPLTVVLKKREIIPDTVTGGLDSVAIRVPSSKIARDMIAAAGVPIAAPSANSSGRPSPTLAAHVIEDMNGKIDMIIDGGDCDIGLESTIVKIDGDRLILLRPGKITPEMLAEITDKLEFDKAISSKLDKDERPQAPGMKYRHYAPKTRIVMIDGEDSAFYEFLKTRAELEAVGALIFDDEARYFEGLPIKSVSLGDRSLTSEAHNLFDKLRKTDEFGCDVFYVRMPKTDGLGLAIYNRMIKAAAHEIIKL